MARTALKRIVTAGAAVLATLLIGCGSSNQSQDPANAETSGDSTPAAAAKEENTCTADAECAKDACCHAAGCVPSTRAPSCDDVMCTMDCKEGTMDCGKGACACIDGACGVRWAE